MNKKEFADLLRELEDKKKEFGSEAQDVCIGMKSS